MTPTEYVEMVVLPTVRELLKTRDDKRLAYLSCIATFHICDYIAYSESSTVENVKNNIATVCNAALVIVGSLCNGTKHAKPRGKINLTDVRCASAFAFDTPGAGWDEGAWDGPVLYVEDNGNTLFVHQCVQAVILTTQSLYPKYFSSVDLSAFEDYMKDWHRAATTSGSNNARN